MSETRKWIFHRISAIILAPLFAWFYFSLISLSEKNYQEAIYFFENPLFKINDNLVGTSLTPPDINSTQDNWYNYWYDYLQYLLFDDEKYLEMAHDRLNNISIKFFSA